jgi:hypothetical protein
MKQNIVILSLFIAITVFCPEIYGQQDSVSVEKTTENITKSDYKFKWRYKYFDPNFKIEKNLVKLGLSPLGFFTSNEGNDDLFVFEATNMFLGIEKKLNPSLSILLSCNQDYLSFNYFENNIFVVEDNRTLSGNIGIRYYYSMKKRIRDSIGVNNFHSNYFSIELCGIVKYEYGNTTYSLDHNVLYDSHLDGWTSEPFINLSWGAQRRIGNWGFVDAGPYIQFNKDSFGFGVNLLLGLGLGF